MNVEYKCPNCGKEISIGEIKCPNCGYDLVDFWQKIQSQAQSQQPQQVQQPMQPQAMPPPSGVQSGAQQIGGVSTPPMQPPAQLPVQTPQVPSSGIKCPNCGYLNPSTAKFCQNCGASLQQVQQPMQPQAMPPPSGVQSGAQQIGGVSTPPMQPPAQLPVQTPQVPQLSLGVGAKPSVPQPLAIPGPHIYIETNGGIIKLDDPNLTELKVGRELIKNVATHPINNDMYNYITRIHKDENREQFIIYKRADGFYIEDRGSSNHTFVNGEDIWKKGPRKLNDNDVITIPTSYGDFKMIFKEK